MKKIDYNMIYINKNLKFKESLYILINKIKCKLMILILFNLMQSKN